MGAAGDHVHGRAVGAAVVGQQLLNLHPVAFVEHDCAVKERDHGAGLLVGENLGVGQAGAVIDRDVHALPANCPPLGAAWTTPAVVVTLAGHPVPSAALDPA